MEPRYITLIFCTAILAVTIVYDLAAYSMWGVDGTISGVTRWAAANYPFMVGGLSFAMGAYFAHLFLRSL